MHQPPQPAGAGDGSAPQPARYAPAAKPMKRQRLIANLRGYFLSPVIASLGECGVADRMLQGPFSLVDFQDLAEPSVLDTIFRYLESVGLLVRDGESRYTLTEDGFTSLSRNGAYSLLVSYAEYFDQLPSLLAGVPASPAVNRPRNVRGSGHLHGTKFFPSALDCLQQDPPTALIDIGCGDGAFLECACTRWTSLLPFGLDLSEAAIEIARRRLAPRTSASPGLFVANARDVRSWSLSFSPALRDTDSLVISMWFVGHEFSANSIEVMIRFFKDLHECFPRARVLVGEIVKIAPEDLSAHRDLSIMPEYLLFHELSRQGVLGWPEWQSILRQIPYHIGHGRHFDEITSSTGAAIPASFLWLLRPATQPSS